MSEQYSVDGASPWTERASGPPPRWYVYVAAIICAATFSNAASGLIYGLLEGFVLRQGDLGPLRPWMNLVTGAVAGLIWGGIFFWARRLRLVIVAPLIAVVSLLSLGLAFYELGSLSGRSAEAQAVLRAVTISTSLHVAAFWVVFLALAIPPRRGA